mgnify:CR=1 FL=1
MRIEDIAAICYEVNRAYSKMYDNSVQIDWELAPAWAKRNVCDGVKFVLSKTDCTPQQWHEFWCKEKKDEGWQYGKEHLLVLKTHPCILPWDKLSKEQKHKAQIFVSTVNALRDNDDNV